MDKYLIFSNNLEDFVTESEILKNKDYFEYETFHFFNIDDLEIVLNLAQMFESYICISEETYNNL